MVVILKLEGIIGLCGERWDPTGKERCEPWVSSIHLYSRKTHSSLATVTMNWCIFRTGIRLCCTWLVYLPSVCLLTVLTNGQQLSTYPIWYLDKIRFKILTNHCFWFSKILIEINRIQEWEIVKYLLLVCALWIYTGVEISYHRKPILPPP